MSRNDGYKDVDPIGDTAKTWEHTEEKTLLLTRDTHFVTMATKKKMLTKERKIQDH